MVSVVTPRSIKEVEGLHVLRDHVLVFGGMRALAGDPLAATLYQYDVRCAAHVYVLTSFAEQALGWHARKMVTGGTRSGTRLLKALIARKSPAYACEANVDVKT
jgi:hypothetical protein